MFQFKYRKYRTSSFHFVCCWWIQGINKYIFKTEPLVCLIHFRKEKEHEGLLSQNQNSSCEVDQETCD